MEITQEKLKGLSKEDYRYYQKTGIYRKSPEEIQFINTKLNNDDSTFLNGSGVFRKPPSGGVIINITYDELITLILVSGLTANQQYRLTDYQTVHYMFNAYTRLDEINTGSIEPLILTANSVNNFYVEAKSETYPQDIIFYDWNPNNWMLDIAFATAENATGGIDNPDFSNVTSVSGFKGAIYRRIDTKNNNDLGYDFRNVKFRRWKFGTVVYSLYDSGITYTINEKIQVTGSTGGVYVSLTNNNSGNTLTDTNYWSKIISYEYTEYWNCSENDTDNPTDYIDCLTFHSLNNSSYDTQVYDNKFNYFNGDYWLNTSYPIKSILLNTVFYLTTIDYILVNNNEFGVGFQLNTIIDVFYSNRFGDNNFNMTFGSGNYNFTFGSGNYDMTFGNNNYRMEFGNGNYNFTFGNDNSNLRFGNGNFQMTFGSGNFDMTFGYDNYQFTFGNINYGMTFESSNNNITFGDANNNITFGYDNYQITFGNGNYQMTFECSNNNITFGDTNHDFTFGYDNYQITFSNINYGMSFGNINFSMSFGNNNNTLIFGDANNNITFTYDNNQMSFGNGNQYMTFDNSSNNLTFGNDNYSLTFGDTNDVLIFGSNNANFNFSGMTIINNVFKNNMDGVGINLAEVLQLSDNYDCSVFSGSDNKIYLKYFNGTTEQYVLFNMLV